MGTPHRKAARPYLVASLLTVAAVVLAAAAAVYVWVDKKESGRW